MHVFAYAQKVVVLFSSLDNRLLHYSAHFGSTVRRIERYGLVVFLLERIFTTLRQHDIILLFVHLLIFLNLNIF